MAEPDGHSARDHIKSADPDDDLLRMLPPPVYAHLWLQYVEVSSDKQALGFGEPVLTFGMIRDWADCFPVSFSPFKVRMLKHIDIRLRGCVRELRRGRDTHG